jgi:hypothetical protein
MALTNAGVERSFKILLIWLFSYFVQLRAVPQEGQKRGKKLCRAIIKISPHLLYNISPTNATTSIGKRPVRV